MRVIKARVAYAAQQLNHMRTRLRNMQREMLAPERRAKMRGVNADDSALKQVLETVVEDNAQLTSTMGALEAHHNTRSAKSWKSGTCFSCSGPLLRPRPR